MIGDRIKERRTELGLTQDELAHKVGYKSRSTVNKIELNQRGVPAPQIKRFAEILGVSPVWLLDMDSHFYGESNPSLEEILELKYGTDAYRILQKFLMLSDRNKIRIEERMDMLLEESK